MKNFASLSSLFGKKEDQNDYDKYYRDDYYDESEKDYLDDNADADDDVTTYAGAAEKPSSREGVSFNANSAPVSLKVVKPKSSADGPAIADYLSAGSTVVLNIESLTRESAIRLIDFLMGAVHVLGGDMKSVTKTTLVFAPQNVGVSDYEPVEEAEEAEETEE